MVWRGVGKIRRDEKGFTGLEAAIVLIAFVVVAAVFSYVMLGAGFYTTQKSKQVVDTGVKQASSSLTLDGQYIYLDAAEEHGGKTGSNGEVSVISFYVTQTAGGSPVDLEKTSIAITTATGYKQEFFKPLSVGEKVYSNDNVLNNDGDVVNFNSNNVTVIDSIEGRVAVGANLIVKDSTGELVNGTVERIITVYLNNTTNSQKVPMMGIVVSENTNGTLIVPRAWWYVGVVGDNDNTVEMNEKYKLILAVNVKKDVNQGLWASFSGSNVPWEGIGTIKPNDVITVEVRPPIGAPLTITKQLPPSFTSLTYV